MNTKQKTLKNSTRLLALFLSMLFLFVGCGGEDKSFEQLCDINTGLEPKLSGLQDSGDDQMCYQVVLVRLDKELVQDVQKVSVKTERVDKTF